MKKKIRILIADDHFLVRMGMATSINMELDMTVVAEASTGTQAVEFFGKHKPDIVLMDLRLPMMNGDEATATICREFPGSRVIIISTYDGHEDIYRSLQAGARSYLSKSIPRQEMLHAIRVVHNGEHYLPLSVSARLAERVQMRSLSEREREVLSLVVKGLTNKEIAQTLAVAEITVKNHVSNILLKLCASDRTHASTIAIQCGIVHLQ